MSRYLEKYKVILLNKGKSDCEKNNRLRELSDDLDISKFRELILSKENVPLLRHIWKYLAADNGRRLDSHNYTAEKLQFHKNALSIMNKVLNHDVGKFILLDVIQPEDTKCIFDLLDMKNQHVNCCYDSINYTWTRNKTKQAHELLFGQKLQVLSKCRSRQDTRYGELFDIVLATEDGCELIADQLADNEIGSTPHFRDFQQKTNNDTPEYCYISHMVNPQYVWIQLVDDLPEFEKLQTRLKMRKNFKSYTPPYNGNKPEKEKVIVRIPDKITYRGQILQCISNTQYLVLAIDFGWTCLVPVRHLYEISEEEDDVMETAMLCKLVDILPCNSVTRLQLASLSLLSHVTKINNWAKQIMTRDNIKLLLKMLHNSQNIEMINEVVAILAAVSIDRDIGASLKEPVTGQITKYLECVDVMRSAMLFYYNLMIRNEKVSKMIIKGSGIELLMKIYAKHKSDSVISDYFILIAKHIFKDTDLEITPAVPEDRDVLNTTTAHTFSTPRPTSNYMRDPDFIPDTSKRFSQGIPLADHGIVVGERVSFLPSLTNSEHRDNLARELVSMFNTSGGKIYIGVDPTNCTIKGMKLTKNARDEIRLLLSDILVDKDIMRHSKFEKIPETFVDIEFEEINNIFRASLKVGEMLMIAVLTVDFRNSSGGIVKFNETKDKSINPDEYNWVYYGRSDNGRRILEFNEIRQLLAKTSPILRRGVDDEQYQNL